MEDSSEEFAATGLANIYLATTPHQSFERADRMLTQSATIRECAQALQNQVQILHTKADTLHENALRIQRQGLQDRESISKEFKDLIEQYSHVMTTYKSKTGYSMDKLELAVEEGRARMEDVEALADKLFNFTKATASHNAMSISSPADLDMENNTLTSDEVDILLFSAPPEPDPDYINRESSTAPQQPEIASFNVPEVPTAPFDGNNDSSPISPTEHGFVEPEPSDDGYEFATSDPEADTYTISRVSDRKRKLERPPKAADSLNEDDELPVFKRKKKPRRNNREYRKKQLLSGMGYTDNEISELDLNEIETPLRRQRPWAYQRRHKSIRVPFIVKSAPPQPPAGKK